MYLGTWYKDAREMLVHCVSLAIKYECYLTITDCLFWPLAYLMVWWAICGLLWTNKIRYVNFFACGLLSSLAYFMVWWANFGLALNLHAIIHSKICSKTVVTEAGELSQPGERL